MRLQGDGDFEVSLNEVITVEIEATDTAFLAHTGPLQVGQWTSIQHPSAGGNKEIRKFTVTESFSKNFNFVVGFDFSLRDGKIPATAQYLLRITGTGPGGFDRPRTIRPTSILPTVRAISFEVGQG